MSRLTRDGTAEPVSRDQNLRHARGQGNVYFPCSADHEQDWQPYPVDPYSAICDDHTYIHTLNINRLWLPILLVVSWTGKNIFPYPSSRPSIWSHERGSVAPSNVSSLIHHTIQAESSAYKAAFLLPTAFHDGVHLHHQPSQGQS